MLGSLSSRALVDSGSLTNHASSSYRSGTPFAFCTQNAKGLAALPVVAPHLRSVPKNYSLLEACETQFDPVDSDVKISRL